MTKPIFIIRIPFSATTSTETLRQQIDEVGRKLHIDYHVLPVLDSNVQQIEFECYNPVKASDKNLEEIKQMVLKQFENEQ